MFIEEASLLKTATVYTVKKMRDNTGNILLIIIWGNTVKVKDVWFYSF